MDDKRIHDLLEEFAEKEIPNDMNIWDDVKTSLTLPGRAARSRSMSLVLALLLMLGAAIAVYAVVNQQITGDPGVEGAREANLVTDLNLSQTINGVTLNLAWVYADDSRMVFGYSVTSPQGQQGTDYGADVVITDSANSFWSSGGGGGGGGGSSTSREAQYILNFGVDYVENPPTTLDMRVEFILEARNPAAMSSVKPDGPPPIFMSDAAGLGDIATEVIYLTNSSADPVDLTGWTVADQSQHLYTFPSFTLDPNTTVVLFTRAGDDTTTELYWGEEEAIWVPGEVLTLADTNGAALGYFTVGGRSGGGGGGDSGGSGSAEGGEFGGGFGFGGYPEGTPEPGIRVFSGIPLQNPLGPFVFTFPLPYIPAIDLTPNQTVEANGVSMTLDTLSVTPSTTTAHFCYSLPTEGDWMPVVKLLAGEIDASISAWGMDVTSTPEDVIRCGTTTFYAPYQLEPVTFTFTVEELQTSASFTAEKAEQFVAILAEQGIEVEVLEASGEGFNYNLISTSDENTGLAISRAINQAFSDHYVGSWVFTVAIPALER